EDLAPFAKGLVGGDQQGSPLVPGSDEFEQYAGLGLILGDVSEVIEDQQVIFVEFGDGSLKSEFSAGDLQPLHQIGGACEQHAPAAFDESKAERCRQVTLSGARRSSVILPGVRESKFGSPIRFTHAAVKSLRSSA